MAGKAIDDIVREVQGGWAGLCQIWLSLYMEGDVFGGI